MVPLLGSDVRHHSVIPSKAQEYCSHEAGLRIVHSDHTQQEFVDGEIYGSENCTMT